VSTTSMGPSPKRTAELRNREQRGHSSFYARNSPSPVPIRRCPSPKTPRKRGSFWGGRGQRVRSLRNRGLDGGATSLGRTRLRANPRSAGKMQGIPLKSGRYLRVSGGNRAGLQHSQPRFPYSAEQGMIDRGTRMFRTGVGKPIRGVCRSAVRQAASRQLLDTPRAATLASLRGA
jgi:hypothetical protein